MEQALREYESEFDFVIRRVPIDNDAELERAHGTKVPVLVCEDMEICHYFLDKPALMRVLS